MQFSQGYLTCVIFHIIMMQTESNVLMTTVNNNVLEVFENSTINCIAKLTKKFIYCRALVTLVDKANVTNPLIKSLSYKGCYPFILRPKHTHSRLPKTDVYIISSLDVGQFTSTVNELAKEVAWNPKARFFLTVNELEKEEIFEIFETLLAYNIIDALIIRKDKNEVIKVYSYFPFANHKCGQVTDDIIKEEDCNNVDTIEDKYKTIENKFKNCSVVVAASEDILNFIFSTNTEFAYLGKNAKGIEQYMLQNIAKMGNLRIEYLLAGPNLRNGVVLPNHTITGVLGYLQNNTVGIAAGGFLLIRNRVELFDFIWGYNYASIYLFTPAFGEEKWKIVYQEFNISTWILIVLSFVFTSAAVITVRKYLVGKDDMLLLVIIVWGYIYGNTDFGLYRVKKMRFIIIIWVLFTFFISSFYNTAYYSLLTRLDLDRMREKPKSLESWPLKPCVTFAARTFYKFNFNETLPGETSKNCRNTKLALESVANSDNLYTLELEYSYKLREYRYIDEEGKPKLQRMKYSSDMIFVLYTKRGFPLLQKFQRYAAYHFESGIFLKHLEDIYHSNKIFHQQHKAKYRNSRLSDYKIHFCVLCFGYFISTVCFIIEILNNRVR